MRTIALLLTATVLCAACGNPAPPPSVATPGVDSTAHLAHAAYVTAINSNNLDELLGVLTDDVVFLSAHEPAMVGKAAVRPWLEAYLKAYKTHWDKPVQEFVVNGKWRVARDAFGPDHPPTAR